MITVFDLDGVLSRADTMAALVMARLRKRPWLGLPIIALATAAGSVGAMGRLGPRCNRAIVHIALRGTSAEEYRQLAEVTARHLSARPGNTPSGIVQAARAASESGSCLVTTATEYTLASCFLEEIGIRGAEVCASMFVFERSGPRFRVHNVGMVKAVRFQTMHPTGHIERVYTDSASDLPLAELSREVVLVNLSRRSIRAFRRAGIRFRLHSPHVPVASPESPAVPPAEALADW